MVEKKESKVRNLKNKVKNLSEKTQKINDKIIKGIKYRESFFHDITKLDKNIDKIINSIANKKTKTNKINPAGKKSESINKNNVVNNNPVKSNKSRKKSINKNNVANNNPVKRNKSVKKPKSVKSNVANNNRPRSVNKEPEEIVIYIPADREENRGPLRKNIEQIRKEKINYFLGNQDKEDKLDKFNFDLKTPTKDHNMKYQEMYFRLIINNLKKFFSVFCFFKYSGKEKENYETKKHYVKLEKKKALEKLNKAEEKYNKNRTNQNKKNLEDAEYNLERIDIELEIKKKEYEDFKKTPNKLADLVFNKLVNVKQEQSINNKKLYAYEILGFDELSYKKMIDMCIDLRNSKIDNIDLSDANSKNIDKKKFIKYNDIVNGYLKSMLDTLQNKKIVYKIK